MEAYERGPRALPIQYTCQGCPALVTEWWNDYLDNDETDSGTMAWCTAVGPQKKCIDAYWSERKSPPEWCPCKSQ